MARSREKSEHHPLVSRQRPQRKNICPNSKAALLILLWNTLVELTYNCIVNPEILMKLKVSGLSFNVFEVISPFWTFALIVALCFPLSGCLGDIKCGHFKIVKNSFSIMVLMPFLFLALGSVLVIPSTVDDESTKKIVLSCVLAASCLAILITLVGFVMYFANILPLAMDQLRDLPSRDTLLFFKWFMWTYYLSIFLAKLIWSVILHTGKLFGSSYLTDFKMVLPGVFLLILTSISVSFFLLLSLLVAKRRKRWFNIEPGYLNPYKLVYRVTKFACQHKVPIQRSAFTYCEDTKPSRLDLAKDKYGGPCTNEQVEDVKIFYRILKVLLCFGPIFSMNYAANSLFPIYDSHLSNLAINWTTFQNFPSMEFVNVAILRNELLSTALIVVLLPLWLCLHFQFMPYTLGVLRRMELGMLVSLLNLLFLFAVDTVAHARNNQLGCMLDFNAPLSAAASFTPVQSTFLFIAQQVFSAIAHTMMKVSYLEFICAQSPHSMKGMFIGLSYAIKGIFIFAAGILVIPFVYWKMSYPSCEFGYYSLNILLGCMAFLLFVYTTKQYKYRERDEISRAHEYAENYYSKTPQEMSHDYT